MSLTVIPMASTATTCGCAAGCAVASVRKRKRTVASRAGAQPNERASFMRRVLLASVHRLDAFHQREEAFGKRRVGVHGTFQQRVRKISHNEHAEHLDQLAALGA